MGFFTPVAEKAEPKTYELLSTGYYVFKLLALKQVADQIDDVIIGGHEFIASPPASALRLFPDAACRNWWSISKAD